MNDKDAPLVYEWSGRLSRHSFHLVRRLIMRGTKLSRPTHPVWRDVLLLLLLLLAL
jgi:hypothetical protein